MVEQLHGNLLVLVPTGTVELGNRRQNVAGGRVQNVTEVKHDHLVVIVQEMCGICVDLALGVDTQRIPSR